MASRLAVYLLLIAVVILVGTPGFMVTEGLSPVDALYFCVVTIATVGYGDIHPISTGGKVLAMFVIVGGVGSFAGVVVNSVESWFGRRERQTRMKKMNLLIGAFFSEMGIRLLVRFSRVDPNIEEIRDELIISGDWNDEAFSRLRTELRERRYPVEITRTDLKELRTFLLQNKAFLIHLLENPMVFEEEWFTETLQALFHLTEELGYRTHLPGLPPSDLDHLAGDISRCYRMVTVEWVEYIRYLQSTHPYLFSLALRINPFDQDASPVVE